ncbi:hypothetical protein GQ53DRAFT_517041 [Thozetella sp. PMI_491]|nr:hypothetical protein GQ53DRAFT_517041 [Thozetella sp. PMI_491]
MRLGRFLGGLRRRKSSDTEVQDRATGVESAPRIRPALIDPVVLFASLHPLRDRVGWRTHYGTLWGSGSLGLDPGAIGILGSEETSTWLTASLLFPVTEKGGKGRGRGRRGSAVLHFPFPSFSFLFILFFLGREATNLVIPIRYLIHLDTLGRTLVRTNAGTGIKTANGLPLTPCLPAINRLWFSRHPKDSLSSCQMHHLR